MFEKPSPLRVAVVVATVVLAATVGPVASAASPASSPTASFSPSVVYEERGDVATITVRTSDGGVVNIGSPSAAFWMQVKVGSGTTKLHLDTYKAGVLNESNLTDALSGGGTVIDRTATATPVDKPLAAAQYNLNVTRTARNDRQIGVGKLILEERATRGIEARIAPRERSLTELDEWSEVAAATQVPWGNGSVARDDWVAVRVNATGLSGMISKGRLGEGGNDTRLVFEQTNPGMNVDSPNKFNGTDVTDFVPLEEGFYVLVDTGNHSIKAGDEYNVSFVVEADSNLADEREVVSTSIEVVERRIEVERNGPGGSIVVDGETTVTGTTSLTPGTTIDVVARDDELPPFHRPRTVTVTPNRTFAATFDFSDLEPGREFEFGFPDQEKTVPGVVAIEMTTTTETTPPTTNGTPTTTPNGTAPSNGTTTANGTPTATTTPPATNTTTTTTAEGLTQVAVDGTAEPLTQQAAQEATTGGDGGDGSVPGFGPVAGAVAAVAAALLAARRR